MDWPGAERFGAQVIEHRCIAPDLVLILQEKAAGKVLQVHHGGIGGVGNSSMVNGLIGLHLRGGAEWQDLQGHVGLPGHARPAAAAGPA